MPTYPNNALDTSGLDFDPTVQPKKKGKEFKDLDLSELNAGFESANVPSHVKIDPPADEFSVWDATAGSIGRGVQTSMIGTSLRVAEEQHSPWAGMRQFLPDLGMNYFPDQDDIKLIMDSGISVSNMDALYKSLASKEDLASRIKVLRQNEELRAASEKQGVTGTIFHGVGDAIGDPTSYMGGPLGAAAKAGKLGKIVKPNLATKLGDAAFMAGVSEATLRNSITGEEADVTGAIAGAMLFTGAIHGVGKAFEKSKMRIDASETARNTNSESPLVMKDHDGTRRDLDEDSEVLESGLVVSKGVVPPKASVAGRMKFLRDVSTAIHASNDKAVRELGSLMTNPTQGYKGDFRNENVTVEDMKNTLDMRANKALDDVRGALDAYTNRSSIYNGKGYEQHRAEVSATVFDAAEGKIPLENLPTELQTIVKHIREQMDMYDELTNNPSLLTGKKAPALKAGGRENYMPHQWRDDKLRDLRSRYGQDEAHRLLRESAIEGYRMDEAGRAANDAEIKAHFKSEEGEVTPEMVEKYYNDKTYGIIAEDAPMTRHANDSGEATSSLDYFKHRMGVNLMGVVKTPDGQDFRLDDMLDKNTEAVLSNYMRAVNGRLSLVSVTGMDEAALAKKIANMSESEGKTALEEFMKVVKGTSRSDYDGWDLGADLLRDVTYGLTNGKMGINAIFEAAVNLGRTGYAANVARTVNQAFGKDPLDFSKADIVEHVVDGFLGTHLTQRLNLSFADYKAQMATRMRKDVDELDMLESAAIAARYKTTQAVQWSPQARMVDGMQKIAVDTANNTAVSEMFASARTGFTKGILADEKFLKSNHIGENIVNDAKGIIADIQKAYEADGFPKDPNWLQKKGFLFDARASSLSRIAYAYSDETLQKQNRAGQAYLRPLGPLGRLFMQFKRFAVGSSQYASKVTKDIVKYRRLDQAGALAISFGTAYIHYASLTMMDTIQMTDRERREYLKENFSPSMQAWGMLKRNQMLAFHGMGYDTLGIFADLPGAGIGRTTGDQFKEGLTDAKASSGYGMAQSVGGNFMSNVPAARVVFGAGSSLVNLGKYGYGKVNPYAFNRAQEDRLLTEFARNFGRAAVNNDPISQGFYKMAWNQLYGVDLTKKK